MHSKKEEIELLKEEISSAIPGAISRLYTLTNVKLKMYLIQLSGGDRMNIANDTIQELFLWIAKNHHKLNSIKNLEPYLFKAAKFNYLRELKKLKLVNLKNDIELNEIIRKSSDFSNSCERDLINIDFENKKNKWLNNALSTLPKSQREALYLKFYANLNYDEMSEVLDVSNQICRNYICRAISTLRKKKSFTI